MDRKRNNRQVKMVILTEFLIMLDIVMAIESI